MRYVFGFLAAVGLIVVVFVLVVRGFGGGKHSAVQTDLLDYSKTQTIMRMIIEGPVNVDQNHRVAQVDVGRSGNTINLFQGYQGHVTQTKNYESNEEAYATFLRALQLQGYTKGIDDPARQDSRGVCPSGKVYTFEIVTGSAVVQRFWTTSCGGGTFRGNTARIRMLFQAQIPDYGQVTRGAGLN